jgi:phosphomannomutase
MMTKGNPQKNLERIKNWLEQDHLEWSCVWPMFVTLHRILTEAENPEIWDPATELTHRFLDVLNRELIQDQQWPHAESAKLFSALLTILAEAGQYRHETYSATPEHREQVDRCKLIYEELLPQMGKLREHAINVAKQYFIQPIFSSIKTDIETEIFPLLESLGDNSGENSERARDRYMPFRVIQVGNVVEQLYSFRLRTSELDLVGDNDSPGLLRKIYDHKYARFGTSGVRGRWELDFTETRAKRVVQAICDFLKASDVPEYVGAENLQGKLIVIGYDSRRNARLVAEWTAQVCLANGFKVDLANRDTPTPALVYYLTDHLALDEVAGLINCTASHNPPEWQGIKLNPRLGYPAPTSLTDFIAARANELQMLDTPIPVANLAEAEARGDLQGFDPIVDYTNWILNSGKDNQRISIDPEKIRKHFADKMVVIDEMHGASRGYLSRLLGEIGVRHKVIHAERDPNLPGLDYADPEEPFIDTLKATVAEMDDAMLGVGMDTDADRFGVVDWDGTYYRPNQVLPMLVRYLGIDRELTGRIIATQTGSPLIEELARQRAEKLTAEGRPNEQDHPEWEKGVLPAFVDHPFYQRRLGEREDQMYKYTFMVPVGIKYIEEQRRTDRSYRFLEELPEGWRNTILIGGEESSGLTTRGHVTDKDGVWANLLIMDMVAHYGGSIREIWEDTVKVAGWKSFGGHELDPEPSNTGRADVDAVLEAKEGLINDFLDRVPSEGTFAGLKITYAGGIRYDFGELRLLDEQGGDQNYLRVRASGTEPINRIYVESSDRQIAKRLAEAALQRLAEHSAAEIKNAHSPWRLADILSSTRLSPSLIESVRSKLTDAHWSDQDVITKLKRILPTVEHRNQEAIEKWITALKSKE